MVNLQYLRLFPRSTFVPEREATNAEGKLFFFDWIYNRALKFMPSSIVDQAAANRRSDSTDDAVIADFNQFEQPHHIIPKDRHYQKAVDKVRDLGKPDHTLYPISFPDLRYYPWNLPPNICAPWNNKDHRFQPAFRDLDGESQSPKLIEKVKRGLTYFIRGSIKVTEYLRIKQALGMITDSKPSFHNLYNEIFIYNRTLIHQIKEGSSRFFDETGTPIAYYWHSLFARAHTVAHGELDKIRAVFGATKLLLMVENMFIWQLHAYYLNNPDKGFMLWGREIIRGGWKKILSETTKIGNLNNWLSLDWSEFDKRLLHELIDEVHNIWRSYFDFARYQPTSFYPHANPGNPQRIERLWKWMTWSIKHTPILLPNGELWKWNYNGFASGFQQTQLMDSFANAIMILTCLSAMGIDINSVNFWIRVQGDDSIIAFMGILYQIYGPTALTELSRTALFYFNAKLSDKKSQFQDHSNGMSVLSFFNRYGLPYRTKEDLLTHLFFPEHNRTWSKLASAALGLAYANAGKHEDFHNLCEYIWNKIVHEKGILPEPNQLAWMSRAHIFPTDMTELEAFKTLAFPKWHEIRSLTMIPAKRTENEVQRIWPTKPGPKGNFYFL
jgi:hypothetical protein